MANNHYLRAFTLRGKNRKQILEKLKSGEKTQAQLHHEIGLYRTHVRRTLLELEEKKLVKCLNPKDRIYKIYVLTDKGRKMLQHLK
jgi:DNA-binding MarR family transcriptional regulator